MAVLAAARRAAGSAFANAKHTRRVGELFPAATALPGGVRRSLSAASEVSDLCAHSLLPVPPGAPAELSFDAKPMARP